MKNITKGYDSTYDDRNDYSCGRNRSVYCKYSSTCHRYPVKNERKIDIKKAAAPTKVSCFLMLYFRL